MAKSVGIKPVLEFGEKPEGGIIELTNSSGLIAASDVTENCEGKMVLGEGLVLREAVEKAKAIGAKGVICYGINYRDWRDSTKSPDGFYLAILGGFGVKTLDHDN